MISCSTCLPFFFTLLRLFYGFHSALVLQCVIIENWMNLLYSSCIILCIISSVKERNLKALKIEINFVSNEKNIFYFLCKSLLK